MAISGAASAEANRDNVDNDDAATSASAVLAAAAAGRGSAMRKERSEVRAPGAVLQKM
jgi:hypothetical protein